MSTAPAGTLTDVIATTRWEKSEDGESWELDFELTYTRLPEG